MSELALLDGVMEGGSPLPGALSVELAMRLQGLPLFPEPRRPRL